MRCSPPPLDLKWTAGLFVGIGVAEPCPSTKCWMYFPESDSPFYRVTYLSNYSPEMTPGPGHFSLLAEVSVSEHKPEDAATVIERTIDGMVVCRSCSRPNRRSTKIVSRQLLQVPYSYPVPTLGRDDALAVIQPWLAERSIYSAGGSGRGGTRSATPITR